MLVHQEADWVRTGPALSVEGFSVRSHPQKGRTSIKKTFYSLYTFWIFFVSQYSWMFSVHVLWSCVWLAAQQSITWFFLTKLILKSAIHTFTFQVIHSSFGEDEWKLRYFTFTILRSARFNVIPLRPSSIYLQLPAGQLTHPFPYSVKWPAAGNTTAALLARRGSQEILIPSPTSPDNAGSTGQEIHSKTWDILSPAHTPSSHWANIWWDTFKNTSRPLKFKQQSRQTWKRDSK